MSSEYDRLKAQKDAIIAKQDAPFDKLIQDICFASLWGDLTPRAKSEVTEIAKRADALRTRLLADVLGSPGPDLRPWLQHKDDCESRQTFRLVFSDPLTERTKPCTCGLDNALTASAEVVSPQEAEVDNAIRALKAAATYLATEPSDRDRVEFTLRDCQIAAARLEKSSAEVVSPRSGRGPRSDGGEVDGRITRGG